ncbi:MAG: hypothetical protein ACO2O5_13405 [Candidatus Caldipriscus sp.]|jgi:hypothetical protein
MKAKILPLEDPIKSPIFGRKCVYYRVRVWAIFKRYTQLVHEEQKSVQFILFQKVRKKKRKKFYPIGVPSRDPFSLLTAQDVDRMIVTDLKGFLIEEEVLEV